MKAASLGALGTMMAMLFGGWGAFPLCCCRACLGRSHNSRLDAGHGSSSSAKSIQACACCHKPADHSENAFNNFMRLWHSVTHEMVHSK